MPRPLIACGLAVALLGATGAQAAITSWVPMWSDSSNLDTTASGWNWDESTLNWSVSEVVTQAGDVGLTCDGAADSDPIITLSKDVTNESTVTWTEYTVYVSGSAGVSYNDGSLTYTKFNSDTVAPFGGGTLITLDGTGTVAPGEMFNVTVEITVPASSFTLDVLQTAIPEPTTALLLLLGCVMWRRR